MNNIAFSLFGIDIYWYGLIIMIGMILGVWIAIKLSRMRGYNSDMILDFVILAIPLAIIGARLYYVAFSWEEFAGHLDRIFTLRMSGLAIYGGVIGGVLAAFIRAKWCKMSIWDILDCCVPPLILAQAMGRWGNFFNQELYGAALESVSGQVSSHLALFPPAVYIDATQQWHLGLFLIESLWNLLSFFILLYAFKKKPNHKGRVFWLYILLYCSARAYLEGLRLEQYSLYWGPFRVSQLVSAAMAVVALVMLILQRKKGYKDMPVPEKYRIATAEGMAGEDVAFEEAPAGPTEEAPVQENADVVQEMEMPADEPAQEDAECQACQETAQPTNDSAEAKEEEKHDGQ